VPLTPQVKTLLDLAAQAPTVAPDQLTPAEARLNWRRFSLLGGDRVEMASIEDRSFEGPAGEVALRVYVPHGLASSGRPALVWYHGGGFVIGDLDTADSAASALAEAAATVVVSADYRLAPEHRFPAAVEDCYASLRWVADHGDELGVDPARIAIGGDSAGGNLAAITALMARERGGPAVVFQLLIYPVIDPLMDTGSYRENGSGFLLTASTMRWFWECYLGPDGDPADPYVSPLRIADLSGLPPALVITAEYDPLRDEGEAYAAALGAAGVPADVRRVEGQVHAFFARPGVFGNEAAQAVEDAGAALRSAFGSVSS
jgi:acetyl esterase